MTKEDKKYLLETLEYGLHGCIDVNGDSQTHFNSFANAIEIVKNCSIPAVVGRSEKLVCPECKSTDCKTAIHTDYKECNKCYHYWEAN